MVNGRVSAQMGPIRGYIFSKFIMQGAPVLQKRVIWCLTRLVCPVLDARCNCAWHWVILCMLKCYAWQIYTELLCSSSSKSCIFFIVSFKYENWYQGWSFYLLSVQSYVLIHILLSLKRVTRIKMQFLRVMEPLKGYQVLENDYPLPRVSISINFYRLMYLLLLISRLT